MLVNSLNMLLNAKNNKKAIFQFNINNLEWCTAQYNSTYNNLQIKTYVFPTNFNYLLTLHIIIEK